MKIFKIILVLIGSIILTAGTYFAYQFFYKAGFKPWNDRAYTIEEMYDYSKRHHLIGDYTAYVHPDTPLHVFNTTRTADSSLGFPICRVFDTKGHLFYEAKCFESIPIFLDSIDAPDCFYFRGTDTTICFNDYGTKIVSFTSKEPLLFEQLAPKEFYIMYSWSNVLGHSMKKYRELKAKLKTSNRNIGLISVNMAKHK